MTDFLKALELAQFGDIMFYDLILPFLVCTYNSYLINEVKL